MENNCFFLTLLKSLGLECYAVGARVNMEGGFGGW